MLKFILLTRSKILLLKAFIVESNGKNEKEQLAFGDSIRKKLKKSLHLHVFSLQSVHLIIYKWAVESAKLQQQPARLM